MASETLNIDITAKDSASPVIKKIDQQVEALEKRKTELEIDADSDAAQRELKAIDKQLDELQSQKAEIVVQAKVDSVISDLDKVAAEAKQTAEAADALGRALGPELKAKADTVGIVQNLQKLGLTTDEITANADQLGAKLKEVADSDVGGKLGQSLGTARGKLDEMAASADSSKSVLANMVGNATQDLGALGGLAGSAGVAIGQMGEYMADAAASGDKFGTIVKNFAAVAGPVAALALVVGVATSVMGDQAAAAAASAKRTKEFGEAMAGAANDTLGLTNALKDNEQDMRDFAASANDNLGDFGIAVDRLGEKIPGLGRFFDRTSVDIVKAMKGAGISLYDFSAAVEDGGDASQAWVDQLNRARDAGKLNEEQYKALREAANEYAKEQDKAAESLALSNVDQAEANAMLDEYIAKQKPLERYGSIWQTLFKDMADGTIDTEDAADAVNYLADKLGLTREEVIALAQTHLDDTMQKNKKAFEGAGTALQNLVEKTRQAVEGAQAFNDAFAGMDWGSAGLNGAVTAMSEYTKQHFGLTDIAADSEEAFDKLNKSIKDNGKTFDVATEKGRANQEALEGVAQTLDTKLAAAYADAGGDQAKFTASADKLGKDTLTRLQKELGLSDDETAALGKTLGLTAKDYEARFLLSGTEEAKIKLGLLQGAIDNLPKDVQAKVTQQIITGDYLGALATVEAYYRGHPADLATEAQPPSFGSIIGAGLAVSRHYAASPVPIATTATAPTNLGRLGSLLKDAGGVVGHQGGIGGEVGPEFIQTPRGQMYLTNGPTALAPGTKVTSRVRTRAILSRRSAPAPSLAVASRPNVVQNITNNVIVPRIPTGRELARVSARWARVNGKG